jgi:MT0933-like antitoxin protein
MPDFMDQAKKLADEHGDLVDKGLDKAEAEAEERTGNKYNDQIKAGEEKAEGLLGVDPNANQ